MSENEHPLLRMNGIGKSFGGVPALSDVELTLHAGEVHVLAGENGAGKSTLIKILAGVHAEHSGEIQLDGKSVHFRSPQDASAAGISVIHQELSLIPSMSVMDNIFLGRERSARWGWMNQSQQRAECTALLRRLKIEANLDTPVGQLPLSVQQMIEIAKALAFDARIIVMDEPTSALSEPEIEQMISTIEDLRAAQCAIVYISHRMEEIYRLANRITVLRDGRYVGTAKAADLPRDKFIHWMVGRELNEQFPRRTPQLGEHHLTVKDFTVPDPHGLPRPAVNGVSFQLRRGEILGIGGLQGSGASVMLNALFGAHGAVTQGEVSLDGSAFVPTSPGHSIGRGIALLTSDRKTTGLVLGMNLIHNMTMASLPKYSPHMRLLHGEERKCAEHHREAFRIRAACLGMRTSSLSGGNQQKVALAKWIETQPRLLMLDEPTRGVDIGAKHEIYELMNTWTAQGIGILLITSELPELLALSDRIIAMHRGEITAEFTRESATQEGILNAAMGLEEMVS